MKQPRRLDENGSKDTYRRLQRGALRYASIEEETFRTIEAERPRLIASEGEAVLLGVVRSAALDLQYSFPSRDAFTLHFPSMLANVLPAVSLTEAPMGVRFRLTSRTERPYVEPVLRAAGFDLMREWLRMTLHELPPNAETRDDALPGFLVRGARLEDAEAIAELDAIAFAASYLTPEAARESIEERHVVRLIEDTSTGEAAGFLRLRADGPNEGYVSDIAVHPEYQRRGLGEALMRWSLGWFRQQGMRRASLTVNTDNAGAIALYHKLGFVDDEMGLDYRRPLDQEEVRQNFERQQTVRIQVRRRFSR